MTPEDKAKTTSGRGLWQFTTMPFRLCDTPATFERLVEKVLVDMLPERCLVYLDDLLVHGPCFDGIWEPDAGTGVDQACRPEEDKWSWHHDGAR